MVGDARREARFLLSSEYGIGFPRGRGPEAYHCRVEARQDLCTRPHSYCRKDVFLRRCRVKIPVQCKFFFRRLLRFCGANEHFISSFLRVYDVRRDVRVLDWPRPDEDVNMGHFPVTRKFKSAKLLISYSLFKPPRTTETLLSST